MKKIFIISTLTISSIAFAKEGNIYEYDTNATEETTSGDTPAGPGDPVPVNQYIPVLLLAAVGLAAFYGKKKQISE